jgi:hypothetical protein
MHKKGACSRLLHLLKRGDAKTPPALKKEAYRAPEALTRLHLLFLQQVSRNRFFVDC